MLRQRLVRQSAVNVSSSSDSTTASMPSPEPIRRRRNSQDAKMFKQLSSESLDNLLTSSSASATVEDRRRGGRRHSVACGVLYVDMPKPSLKSAFNSAMRRMSDACSLLSSNPSSTYNLSTPNLAHISSSKKKEGEVILPPVLGTYRQNRPPPPKSQSNDAAAQAKRDNFQMANRRFSTDCPPPSYAEATCAWKQPVSKQKILTRQPDVHSKSSLVALEDDDSGNGE